MLGFLRRSQSFFWSHMTIKYHIQNLIYMCSKIGIAGKLASREGLRLKKTKTGHFTSQRPLQSLKTSEISVFKHKIYYKKLKILKKIIF